MLLARSKHVTSDMFITTHVRPFRRPRSLDPPAPLFPLHRLPPAPHQLPVGLTVERDCARVEQRVQAQKQFGGHRRPDHVAGAAAVGGGGGDDGVVVSRPPAVVQRRRLRDLRRPTCGYAVLSGGRDAGAACVVNGRRRRRRRFFGVADRAWTERVVGVRGGDCRGVAAGATGSRAPSDRVRHVVRAARNAPSPTLPVAAAGTRPLGPSPVPPDDDDDDDGMPPTLGRGESAARRLSAGGIKIVYDEDSS